MGNRCRVSAALAFVYALSNLAACGDDPTFTDAAPPADARDVDSSGDDPDADTTDLPPGPVTAFAATNVAAGLDLSWVNPTDEDLSGVLIVAGAGVPVTFAPVDGTNYTVGQVVGEGQAVIFANEGTQLAGFPGIAGVDIALSAWAFDTAGQFSPVATTSGLTNVLGAQDGMIQVFQNGNVVVTTQPRSLVLSGTAVYDGEADTMTVQLTVENQTGRILFNLKGLVETTSQGTATNQPFPLVGGDPMVPYGPAGLAVGLTATNTLSLAGIDGTVDPVVVTMRFVDAPALLFEQGGDLATFDSAGGGGIGFAAQPSGSCGRTESRGGALTRDARYFFTGTKASPRVNRVDLTTLTFTQSVDLSTTTGIGSIGAVALSRDGSTLYGLLYEHHLRGGNASGEGCSGGELAMAAAPRLPSDERRMAARGSVPGPSGGPTTNAILVELDPSTLAEVRRLDLGFGGRRGAVEVLAGNRAAVMVDGGVVAIVDLATWALIDTDAGTAGVQPLDLGDSTFSTIGVSPDGTSFSIAVADGGGFEVRTFASATLAASTPVAVDPVDFNRVIAHHVEASGRQLVFYQTTTKGPPTTGVASIVGGTPTLTTLVDDERGGAVAVDPAGRYYAGTREARIHAFDLATHAELDTDGNPENGVTSLPAEASIRPHGVGLITPF